jgi:hypothetical protein
MRKPNPKQLVLLRAIHSGETFDKACDIAGYSQSPENRRDLLDRCIDNGWYRLVFAWDGEGDE